MTKVSENHEGNNANTLLATVLSKKEKKELLKKSQFTQRLSSKQIWNLCWWAIFKPRKVNKFYRMLQIGNSARFAYEDALHCCYRRLTNTK